MFNNQIFLGALLLDILALLIGAAVAMLPTFIQDVFHYGPEGLGILPPRQSAP